MSTSSSRSSSDASASSSSSATPSDNGGFLVPDPKGSSPPPPIRRTLRALSKHQSSLRVLRKDPRRKAVLEGLEELGESSSGSSKSNSSPQAKTRRKRPPRRRLQPPTSTNQGAQKRSNRRICISSDDELENEYKGENNSSLSNEDHQAIDVDQSRPLPQYQRRRSEHDFVISDEEVNDIVGSECESQNSGSNADGSEGELPDFTADADPEDGDSGDYNPPSAQQTNGNNAPSGSERRPRPRRQAAPLSFHDALHYVKPGSKAAKQARAAAEARRLGVSEEQVDASLPSHVYSSQSAHASQSQSFRRHDRLVAAAYRRPSRSSMFDARNERDAFGLPVVNIPRDEWHGPQAKRRLTVRNAVFRDVRALLRAHCLNATEIFSQQSSSKPITFSRRCNAICDATTVMVFKKAARELLFSVKVNKQRTQISLTLSSNVVLHIKRSKVIKRVVQIATNQVFGYTGGPSSSNDENASDAPNLTWSDIEEEDNGQNDNDDDTLKFDSRGHNESIIVDNNSDVENDSDDGLGDMINTDNTINDINAVLGSSSDDDYEQDDDDDGGDEEDNNDDDENEDEGVEVVPTSLVPPDPLSDTNTLPNLGAGAPTPDRRGGQNRHQTATGEIDTANEWMSLDSLRTSNQVPVVANNNCPAADVVTVKADQSVVNAPAVEAITTCDAEPGNENADPNQPNIENGGHLLQLPNNDNIVNSIQQLSGNGRTDLSKSGNDNDDEIQIVSHPSTPPPTETISLVDDDNETCRASNDNPSALTLTQQVSSIPTQQEMYSSTGTQEERTAMAEWRETILQGLLEFARRCDVRESHCVSHRFPCTVGALPVLRAVARGLGVTMRHVAPDVQLVKSRKVILRPTTAQIRRLVDNAVNNWARLRMGESQTQTQGQGQCRSQIHLTTNANASEMNNSSVEIAHLVQRNGDSNDGGSDSIAPLKRCAAQPPGVLVDGGVIEIDDGSQDVAASRSVQPKRQRRRYQAASSAEVENLVSDGSGSDERVTDMMF